ncbi:SDR family oxidoreductase [Marinobacter segnicrescens]|uniref:NAD(P)-dependent dehydrogenase, short-chain alcohol dehydrogenase family n=1 Tax=Marinobacter segnicrescens TaxID=430453 RepID=A0A1I0CVD1_9GAMM|nr:SDR family oxidoreductase [Marinobacter segnicrescens]SET23775.1 NAD(P)-dependent dehydrogenase, short-chain alcohol dehydrogenase family [Marinobacter segnicrescens]
MTTRFSDKVVLVTGGAAGIGEATARAFAAEGARVVVSDVAEPEGQAVAADIAEQGGDAMFIPCDVSRAGEVRGLIQRIIDTHGRLDCAFNNAGIDVEDSKLADGSEETFDRLMDVNVKGVWLCMKHEIEAMLNQPGGGVIVNTASVAGLGAAPKMAVYSASKHAVIGLTKSAAVEYARKGIRVNAVCPAVIDTDMFRRAAEADPRKREGAMNMHPVGRLGQADEIAQAVLYLCSEGAGFSTGVALPVDGGYTAI